ncbi:MAG TPA: hypothetical protein VM510_09340 [Caulifigura sp.]|jgi:hypothetical protein|nr:hypothetical protein [Caulifigura sp.]
MAKRMTEMKPWQGALVALVYIGGGWVFWMLLSPEDAMAGGTMAVVGVVGLSIVLLLVNLVFKRSGRK